MPLPAGAAQPQDDHVKRIVILGGGTGGTLAANRLRRSHDPEAAEIVVVDRETDHVYQPGLLFVPFGLSDMGRIARPRRQQFRDGISFRQAGIDRVDLGADRVHLDDGAALSYDVLVVATGARLLPEETEGLTGPGWLRDEHQRGPLGQRVVLQSGKQAFGQWLVGERATMGVPVRDCLQHPALGPGHRRRRAQPHPGE
jgi:hypothetical protein